MTDEHGVRRAVILDIDDFEALVRAAEDADDVRAVDEIRRQLDGRAQCRTRAMTYRVRIPRRVEKQGRCLLARNPTWTGHHHPSNSHRLKSH